jgi:hypothetical protein
MGTISASTTFHGVELTGIPVVNPGGWFGETWLLEIGGSCWPLTRTIYGAERAGPLSSWWSSRARACAMNAR